MSVNRGDIVSVEVDEVIYDGRVIRRVGDCSAEVELIGPGSRDGDCIVVMIKEE